MFCDEPIEKVWYLEEEKENYKHWDYPFYFFRPGYYATDGFWIVLETSDHFISLGADGVNLYRSRGEVEKPGLVMNDTASYGVPGDLTVEMLAFVGERILDVKKVGPGWEVEFDHLKFDVVPCAADDFPWSTRYKYIPYQGVSHNLKKCVCGGEAELLDDHVFDYYIRCSKCRRFTNSSYILRNVVADWEAGNCSGKADETPFEMFRRHWSCPVRKVVFPKNTLGHDTDSFQYENLILQYDDMAFKLYSMYLPWEKCVLAVDDLGGYNPKHWPNEMKTTDGENLVLNEFCQDINQEKIVLSSNEQTVVISADKKCINVEIQNAGLQVDWERMS